MWFTPLLLGGGALSGATIARPDSDITTTGWSATVVQKQTICMQQLSF
jgi:hypothetical protein